MAEFIPPCLDGQCEKGIGGSSPMDLCGSMGKIIIMAGGAGLLEVAPCPWDALAIVGPEQDDPTLTTLRNNLGIVDYH